jgi:23S rRNA pseudouridine955/2504/2580 synthase
MSWGLMSKPSKSPGVHLVRVDSDRAGQRLDNFLSTQLKGVPKSAVYRMIRTGQVRINGGRCKASTRLEEGDDVRIPPAHTRERGEFTVSDRVCKQLEDSILYQSHDLLVINKPSGMAVHSGSGLPWGLIDAIRQARPDEYLELAHRLDRETSGCLVLARSGPALKHLSGQFRDGQVQKRYLCLMNGQMRQAVIEADAPLRKIHSGDQALVEVSEQGKPALTRFHLLESYRDCSYAEVELFTGRTHQIRAHARHLGLPLAGDDRYASRESLKKWKKRGLNRIFLHAHRLGLNAPTGEPLTFDAPLPAPLRKVLDGLER